MITILLLSWIQVWLVLLVEGDGALKPPREIEFGRSELVSLLKSISSPAVDNKQLNTNSYKDFHAPSYRKFEQNEEIKTKISQPNEKYRSTRNLKELFIGRCYEYQFRKEISPENGWNCEKLWDIFFNAFSYKNPCDADASDYKDFLDLIDEELPKNQALLWSGSREAAHKYSDFYFTRRFTTLEDTMAGYLVNDLKWCGSKEPPGINFSECPWECSIQSGYWSAANKKFAKKLRGTIHILLNGTRQHLIDRKIYPSYMKDRYYLGPVMVPELRKENIDKVIIIVGHTLHLKKLESCGEKTVQLLIQDIKKKGIPVQCFNDVPAVKHILCVDDPTSKECILAK